MQLLRDELAEVSHANTTVMPTGGTRLSRAELKTKQKNTNNLLYDEIKHKMDGLSQQLKKRNDLKDDTLRDRNYGDGVNRNYADVENRNYSGGVNRNYVDGVNRNYGDGVNRNYEDLKARLDMLELEMARGKNVGPVTSGVSRSQQPETTIIPVCPICSGVGYHSHGEYTFPRDFLESAAPVNLLPSYVSPNRSPAFVTSTPNAAKNIPHHGVRGSPRETLIHSGLPASFRYLFLNLKSKFRQQRFWTENLSYTFWINSTSKD